MVDQNSQAQEDELLSTKAELSRIQSEFQSTKAELSRVQSEFQSTKAELSRVQSELQSTKLELTRIQKELHYAKEESNKIPNTLQSIKEELNRVRTEKEAMNNEIVERQNAIQTQTETVQELEKEKQELLGTVGTLKTQITELQNNLKESKSQFATVQNQFTQMSQHITELETQVNSQNIELSQLKEENKNFSSTLKSFVQASKEMLRSGALEDFPQMRELVLMAVPEYHILDIILKEGIIELTQLQEQLKESREVIEQSLSKLIPEGLVQRAGDYIFHFHFQIEAVDLDQMSATDLFDYAMFNIANAGGEVEKIQETLLELQETLSKRYQNPIIYELLMYASAGDLNDINKVISDLKTWRQRISDLKSS